MKNVAKTLFVFSMLLGFNPLLSMQEPLIDTNLNNQPALFDMDTLLKQLESELPPEEKKARTLQAPAPISSDTVTSNDVTKETPEELRSWPKTERPELPSKKLKTRESASTNKFEKKIVSVFNKIIPIADGLIKSVGSKETQEWVELANKRRQEEAKKVADKLSRSNASRPRSSYSGSSSSSSGWGGRSPYGSSNYGGYGSSRYGGSGGYGGYSSGGNYGSSSFNTPTPIQETPTHDLETTKTPEETKEKDNHGRFAQSEEKEGERALAQKAKTYSATLCSTLDNVLKMFREDKDSLDARRIEKKTRKLQEEFKERNEILASLPTAKQTEIKDKEKAKWKSLMWNIENFQEKCQDLAKIVKTDIQQNKSIEKENFATNLGALISKTSNERLDQALEKIQTKIENKKLEDIVAEGQPAQDDQKKTIETTDTKNIIKEIRNGLEELKDSNFIGEPVNDFIANVKSFLETKPEEDNAQKNQQAQRTNRRK